MACEWMMSYRTILDDDRGLKAIGMVDQESSVEVCSLLGLGVELRGAHSVGVGILLDELLQLFICPIPVVDVEAGNVLLGTVKCFSCGVTLDGVYGSYEFGGEDGQDPLGQCGKCEWPTLVLGTKAGETSECLMLQYRPIYVDDQEEQRINKLFEGGQTNHEG